MPKSLPFDLEAYDQLSPSVYWDLWNAHANIALQALLSFHGASDSSAPSAAADHAADCATELLTRRLDLMAAIKEAQIAAREKERAAKAKPAAKR